MKIGVIDLDALRRDRDQLWAEAAHLEANGEEIELPQHLWAVAGEEQAARLPDDPWIESIAKYLEDFTEDRISSNQLLEEALGIDKAHQTSDKTKHLRQVMETLGWTYKKSVRFPDCKTTYGGYMRPEL